MAERIQREQRQNNMQVEMLGLNQIKPYDKNPRKNDAAVNQVMASIRDFGFRVPIIIDKDGVIVCGHTRYKAAQKLGLDEVPCLRADELTDEQIRAYRIIDNKTQEVSSWDYQKLDQELDAIMDKIDMTPYGFNFSLGDEEYDDEKMIGPEIDNGQEIDISEYSDEAFDCKCPLCGFRFMEGR